MLTPGVKLIEHSEVTVDTGADILTTVPERILAIQPVGGTTVYDVGSVIEPLNVRPPVSTTEVHDNCVQLSAPVSISEVHDNCAQLPFPENDALLGSVVK